MRKVYVYKNGKLVEKKRSQPQASTQLMGDIEPYRSVATGEVITSRSHHRQHLRDNNLVEIGNEQQARFGLPRT